MSPFVYEVTCFGCWRKRAFDQVFPLGWHIVNGHYGWCPRCQVRSAERQSDVQGKGNG